METVGIHFNYRKERRRSLICCLITAIAACFPLLLIMYIRSNNRKMNIIDAFAIFFSHILQFGTTLQFFISFSILLRKISIRFAVLNRVLRWFREIFYAKKNFCLRKLTSYFSWATEIVFSTGMYRQFVGKLTFVGKI